MTQLGYLIMLLVEAQAALTNPSLVLKLWIRLQQLMHLYIQLHLEGMVEVDLHMWVGTLANPEVH